ncbi:MAG: hypothetical protein ACI4LX_09255 [Treponema sp.]
MEVPELAVISQLYRHLLEYDFGRFCEMTKYEIISLAINLALLIFAILSYFFK